MTNLEQVPPGMCSHVCPAVFLDKVKFSGNNVEYRVVYSGHLFNIGGLLLVSAFLVFFS